MQAQEYFNSDTFRHEARNVILMKIHPKDEIVSDFTDVINQIGKKPSDEIELELQKIVSKVRPHIHKVV